LGEIDAAWPLSDAQSHRTNPRPRDCSRKSAERTQFRGVRPSRSSRQVRKHHARQAKCADRTQFGSRSAPNLIACSEVKDPRLTVFSQSLRRALRQKRAIMPNSATRYLPQLFAGSRPKLLVRMHLPFDRSIENFACGSAWQSSTPPSDAVLSRRGRCGIRLAHHRP
jgi:hypothetical protein